jgi:radical SAM superfamily enzyme YgiQ (UPF0313 family)
MMRILFVNAGTDGGYQNHMCPPHVGILAVSSALPEKIRAAATYLDANVVSVEYICRWIKENQPTIVAISGLIFGKDSVITIGDEAKRVGAIVVLGGVLATTMHREMLLGQAPIDFYVRGNGEIPFRKLVLRIEAGKKIEDIQIPGVVSEFHDGGQEKVLAGIDCSFSLIDTGLLKNESAPARFGEGIERIGHLRNVSISMPLITQRGCPYQGKKHCYFCSLMQPYQKIDPAIVEQNSIRLMSLPGVDHLWIPDANVGPSLDRLRQLAEMIRRVKKAIGKDFTVYCFSRADFILLPGAVEIMKAMGMKGVFLGIESGSDAVLESLNKNTTRYQMLLAVELLARHGIEVTCAGLLLGSLNETRQDIKQTVSLVEELAVIGNVASLLVSPCFYPLPQAPSWEPFKAAVRALDQQEYAKLANIRTFSIASLAKLYQRVRPLLNPALTPNEIPTWEELLEARQKMLSIIPPGIQFVKEGN